MNILSKNLYFLKIKDILKFLLKYLNKMDKV